MDYQFYPTPRALAQKAWSLFKNKNFVRVLEPSAGDGSLMAPRVEPVLSTCYNPSSAYIAHVKWDAIEVNPSQHAALRERGARVVGHDFLDFTGGEVYSHIIMNPPFAQGAQHLLHAWSMLYDGEIVCILNAETLKNQFSKERALLGQIVEAHGSVEYIQDAFKGSDVTREADVEIALVHLVKKAETADLVGDILADLRTDCGPKVNSAEFGFAQQLALPTSFVEDLVLRFNAAVVAAKEAAMAEAKLTYYRRILGDTLAERNRGVTATEATKPPLNVAESVRSALTVHYDELKDRAWSGVLRSTEVLSKLSEKARRRVEAEFQTIKELEFTTANVLGFLCGLSEAAGEIQMEMVLDVFDSIVRYHADNTVYYMGWKSNSKHRTAGMRIKTTRFVLPGHKAESWEKSVSFTTRRMLADFDRVFAMLDGKHADAPYGLAKLFDKKFKELCAGNRESSDYFEVRYYPKRGTIHFFPKSKELVDRLNRVVGAQRQWIPPNMAEASADFVTQYEQAEKFDKAVRTALSDKLTRTMPSVGYLLNALTGNSYESALIESATAALTSALDGVLAINGLHPIEALGHKDAQQQLLLLAA